MCYSDTHSYLTNKRCTRLRRHISTTKSLAKNTVKVKFIDRDGDAFTVNAEVGLFNFTVFCLFLKFCSAWHLCHEKKSLIIQDLQFTSTTPNLFDHLYKKVKT